VTPIKKFKKFNGDDATIVVPLWWWRLGHKLYTIFFFRNTENSKIKIKISKEQIFR
jgi:hypothetical protein